MVEAGRGAAAVSDFGRLIGILTDRDVLRSVAARTHRPRSASELMTPDPITAGRDMTLDEAAKIMLENGFRHLPIVEGERAIGIISIRAVLRDATENQRRGRRRVRARAPRALRRLPELDASERPPLHPGILDEVPALACENNLALLNLAASMLEPGRASWRSGVPGREPDRRDGRERRRLRRDRQLRDEGRFLPRSREEHPRFALDPPTIIEGDAFQVVPSGGLAGKTVVVYYYDDGTRTRSSSTGCA